MVKLGLILAYKFNISLGSDFESHSPGITVAGEDPIVCHWSKIN